MSAVGEQRSGERPPLEYDDAVRHCMQARVNPRRRHVDGEYHPRRRQRAGRRFVSSECGAGSAAVWRTFPLKETMRALMHCLGLSKNGSAIEFIRGWSDADDVTGSQGLEGGLQRSDYPRNRWGRGTRRDAEPEGAILGDGQTAARADTLEPS